MLVIQIMLGVAAGVVLGFLVLWFWRQILELLLVVFAFLVLCVVALWALFNREEVVQVMLAALVVVVVMALLRRLHRPADRDLTAAPDGPADGSGPVVYQRRARDPAGQGLPH